MEYNKSEINWLMDKVEKSTDRYRCREIAIRYFRYVLV